MKRISTAAAQQSRFFSHVRRILRSRIALETRMHLPWVSRLLNGGHEVSAGASGYLAGWLLPSVALVEHGR